MQNKSVEELRALAKAAGLSGYSKLRKPDLLKLLAQAEPASKPASKRAAVPAHLAPATARHTSNGDEQRVEDAKFALTPPSMPAPVHAYAADLNENIDILPPITEPRLSLLPQKPGVLQAYWVLDAGTLQRHPGMSLRLCRVAPGVAEIIEETSLPADRGQWYFHVGEDLAGDEVYLQLGYYDPSGEFVTAIHRGVVRLPSLYASSRTDRAWWISDAQFREMYLRAGGLMRGRRLGWGDSFSSR